MRGLVCAVPASVVGFAIPFAVLGVLLWVGFDIPVGGLRALPYNGLAAAIGIALVFGLAAIVNWTPAEKPGFVRALFLVGLSALLAAFVQSFVPLVLDLGPRTYASDSYWTPQVAISVCLLIVSTGIILLLLIRRQS